MSKEMIALNALYNLAVGNTTIHSEEDIDSATMDYGIIAEALQQKEEER